MCGITGWVGRAGDPAALARMTDLIVHRGPDDCGLHVDGSVALGMRRLAIVDRANGRQPIHNESGTITIVFNGEIYNHATLRVELEGYGHRFACHADTEVLVHGYEQWGIEGLLARLNGMFAFAIHDKPKGVVVMARDRVGIKPFYYTSRGGNFYFTSEVKTFKAIREIPFAIDEEMVPVWMALRYVPAPRTLFRNILKLPAGHFVTVKVDGGDFKIERYWHPQPDNSLRSDMEYEERFGELFEDAVRLRTMSEVPVGAYLSEGLDSNLVVWSLAQQLGGKFSTYSIGFGGRHDETAAARASAERFGTDHTEIRFNENHFEELPDIIWHLDEPIGDAHILPSYVLAREAKKKLTVVLLGEGADESLYGYPFYKVSRLVRGATGLLPAAIAERALPALVRLTPLAALNAIFPMPTSLGQDGQRHLADFLEIAPRGHGAKLFSFLSSLYGPSDLAALCLGAPAPIAFGPSYFKPDPDDRSPDGLLRQIHDTQFSGWLQDNILLRHDKMGMAHAIECRVPFLDHRLVEFLAGVPRRLKVSGWKDKVLSRRFAARPDRLGPVLASRPKKPFFLPLEQFLATPIFRELLADTVNPDRIRARGLFRPEAVALLVARAKADNFLALKRLMSLIILELWIRVFIDDEFGFGRSGNNKENL